MRKMAGILLLLVGALFVGSMTTVWHVEVTPRPARQRTDLPLDTSRAPLTLARAAELGRFNMGSTVILLLPPGTGEWLGTLGPGSAIRVGTTLAHLN